MEFRRPEELGPCPECGGPRALFECWTGINSMGGSTVPVLRLGFFKKNAQLWACTCLWCGATTLRPDPDDMERVRKVAEKQFKSEP